MTLTRAEFQGQRDIAHRKQVQARISQLSAGLGLTGLGVVGASALARKKPKLMRIKPHQDAKAVADKWAQKGIYTTVGSTGVGSASSLYFAGTQKKEAAMSNKALQSQKLSKIGKASRAVDQKSPAWEMAGDQTDQRWRRKVSTSAERAHDFALESSRRKEQKYRDKAARARTAGDLSLAGGALVSIGAALKRRPRIAIPAAAIGGVGGAGGYATSNLHALRADRHGESARKIRARGFQRLADEDNPGGFAKDIGKALGAPYGGSVAGRVINRGGKMFFRRGYVAPRRWM